MESGPRHSMKTAADVKARLEALKQEALALPKPKSESDLFDPCSSNPLVPLFYDDCLAACHEPTMVKRFVADGLAGECRIVWRRINSGGHPIRDGLILFGAGLLDT